MRVCNTLFLFECTTTSMYTYGRTALSFTVVVSRGINLFTFVSPCPNPKHKIQNPKSQSTNDVLSKRSIYSNQAKGNKQPEVSLNQITNFIFLRRRQASIHPFSILPSHRYGYNANYLKKKKKEKKKKIISSHEEITTSLQDILGRRNEERGTRTKKTKNIFVLCSFPFVFVFLFLLLFSSGRSRSLTSPSPSPHLAYSPVEPITLILTLTLIPPSPSSPPSIQPPPSQRLSFRFRHLYSTLLYSSPPLSPPSYPPPNLSNIPLPR